MHPTAITTDTLVQRAFWFRNFGSLWCWQGRSSLRNFGDLACSSLDGLILVVEGDERSCELVSSLSKHIDQAERLRDITVALVDHVTEHAHKCCDLLGWGRNLARHKHELGDVGEEGISLQTDLMCGVPLVHEGHMRNPPSAVLLPATGGSVANLGHNDTIDENLQRTGIRRSI